MSKSRLSELLILSTAIGVIATFAAPWYELRGSYSAWRIIEWHTFWCGENAFQLASVVAQNYQVPIEYATVGMQNTLQAMSIIGSVLGAWHIIVLAVLLVVGTQGRLRSSVSKPRMTLEITGLVIVNAIVLYALVIVLALPSSMTQKIDFRTAEEIHTNSLIWSELNIFPIAPALAMLAALGQVIIIGEWLRHRPRS